MKVKNIIPLINTDIEIWIKMIGQGQWTMPRKDLIKSNGEMEVGKILFSTLNDGRYKQVILQDKEY